MAVSVLWADVVEAVWMGLVRAAMVRVAVVIAHAVMGHVHAVMDTVHVVIAMAVARVPTDVLICDGVGGCDGSD
ncbi:hypothetical protein B9Z55_020976 [Caenorhabditis nigoni]|uniref:Uncharacterized protein n=1 Tax=Caenorhabditis nigoni TaxID=1611254 RepID=A0A2G5TQK9_9PELO|nr:hypothetical protein B9Z55_020976 [Caenorhabditis nigoni]